MLCCCVCHRHIVKVFMMIIQRVKTYEEPKTSTKGFLCYPLTHRGHYKKTYTVNEPRVSLHNKLMWLNTWLSNRFCQSFYTKFGYSKKSMGAKEQGISDKLHIHYLPLSDPGYLAKYSHLCLCHSIEHDLVTQSLSALALNIIFWFENCGRFTSMTGNVQSRFCGLRKMFILATIFFEFSAHHFYDYLRRAKLNSVYACMLLCMCRFLVVNLCREDLYQFTYTYSSSTCLYTAMHNCLNPNYVSTEMASQ